jgi:hypothetical protein
VLDQIENWVRAPGHEKQIVILSFARFNVSDADWASFQGGLQTRFGSLLVPEADSSRGNQGTSKVTALKDLWSRGQRVVAYVTNRIGTSPGTVWRRGSVDSPWPNKSGFDDLEAAVAANLASGPAAWPAGTNESGYAADARLFVLQTQPTPDGVLIGSGLLGQIKTLAQLALTVNVPMVEQVWNWWVGGAEQRPLQPQHHRRRLLRANRPRAHRQDDQRPAGGGARPGVRAGDAAHGATGELRVRVGQLRRLEQRREYRAFGIDG